MMYLPKGEDQELSLLFMHYLLKSRRFQVVYLGGNLPLEDVETAYGIHKPDFVYTIITEPFRKVPVQDYVDKLVFTCPESEVLLSGMQVMANPIKTEKGKSRILVGLEETQQFLSDLS